MERGTFMVLFLVFALSIFLTLFLAFILRSLLMLGVKISAVWLLLWAMFLYLNFVILLQLVSMLRST